MLKHTETTLVGDYHNAKTALVDFGEQNPAYV